MFANPMAELSHLLRVQKYQRRRQRQIQDRVQKLQTACEVRHRLLQDQAFIQSALADCIRTENKADFRIVCDSYKDIKESVQSLVDGKDPNFAQAHDTSTQPLKDGYHFMRDASTASRGAVLDLVTRIVSDKQWLTNRLLALDPRHLGAIVDAHQSSSSDRSVFGRQQPSVRRQTSSLFHGTQDTRLASRVWDLSRHDGFSLLMELVGSAPQAVGQPIHQQQENHWAYICSNLILQNQSGTDKFAVAVLDAFAFGMDYPGKRSLETWLMKTLQDGLPLLDARDNPSFRVRTEYPRPDINGDSHTLDAFLDSAVRSLFALIRSNDEYGVIPHRVVQLGRAIVAHSKLSQRSRDVTLFLVTEWLFPSFLHNHLLFPESCGLLQTYFFPENARNRILRAIALRAEHIVSNVLYDWNHNGTLDTSIHVDVRKVSMLFEPRSQYKTPMTPSSNDPPRHSSSPRLFRSLCTADVITLVDTIYPETKSLAPLGYSRPPRSASIMSDSVTSLSPGEQSEPGLDSIPDIDTPIRPTFQDAPDSDNIPQTPSAHDGIEHEDPSFFLAEMNARTEGSQLWNACHELAAIAGPHGASGMRNAMSEQWALLEITKSSIALAYPLTWAHGESTSSEGDQEPASGDEEERISPSLEPDYLAIRKSVFNLFSRFDQAEDAITQADSNEYIGFHPKARTDSVIANNPFRSWPRSRGNPFRSTSLSAKEEEMALSSLPSTKSSTQSDYSAGSLIESLESSIDDLEISEDFVKAYRYTTVLNRVQQVTQASFPLMKHLIGDARRALGDTITKIRKFELLVVLLEQHVKTQDPAVHYMDRQVNSLRTKLWYCTDVRSCIHHDELQKISNALKAMSLSVPVTADKAAASPPTLRHKASIHPRTHSTKTKSGSAIVQLLSADPVLCGSNKLSDTQVSIVLSWMQNDGIENVCPGEERLHRVLCELAKCLNHLIGADASSSPVLWGSELFQRDRIDGENEALRNELQQSDDRSFTSITRPNSSGSDMSHMSRPSASMKRKSYFHMTPSAAPGLEAHHDYFGSRSPTLGTSASSTLWSPSGFGTQTPSSFTSMPSRAWSPKHLRQSISRDSFQSSSSVKNLLCGLRQSLSELLVSDLITTTYANGCETDAACWSSLGGNFVHRLQRRPTSSNLSRDNKQSQALDRPKDTTPNIAEFAAGKAGVGDKGDSNPHATPERHLRSPKKFNMHAACKKLLRRFDLTPSPYVKLQSLYDLEGLLLASDQGDSHDEAPGDRPDQMHTSPRHNEVEHSLHKPSVRLDTTPSQNAINPQRSESVRVFLNFFKDPAIRPRRLFLHLQTIAALIPADILENSPQGTAFCNATIAATSLKHSINALMIETADRIIAHHTANRSFSRPSAAQAARDTASFAPSPAISSPITDAEIASYTLADAASLLTITAKEGHATAQRELATMYLTHPELLERSIMPLTKTGDVFKTKKTRLERDGERFDPLTMCVAQHWMELGAKGGDRLAVNYLVSREEIERIPS